MAGAEIIELFPGVGGRADHPSGGPHDGAGDGSASRGGRPAPPDQAARDRIASDLDTTLFVEAGAGSGKTTALVSRVVSLVATGAAELRSIPAVTFTEKAAAELRDRIRQELERRAAGDGGADAGDPDADPDGEVAERCRAALDQLDGAAIGTLHAFAQRILSDHPVEAGLPPRVEVLDEVSSGVEFSRRWAAFRDELLDEPALERTLLLLFASGVRHEALQVLAATFGDNWDLVEERVPDHAPEPPSVASVVASACEALTAVVRRTADCLDESDKLLPKLHEIAEYLERLQGLDDELDLLAFLRDEAARACFRTGNVGAKAKWDCDVKALKAQIKEAGELLENVPRHVANHCILRLAPVVRRHTLASAEARRVDGRLEFHDLLVMARALLRDPEHGPAVRTRLHNRYERLLLDEFQDTDPIQIELAVRIAAEHPASPEAGDAHWCEVEITPGQLFVVGDPKQSIYRFRRADIATFLAARERLAGTGGGDAVGLDANFRTVAPVIEWVNTVFEELIGTGGDVDVPSPDYRPLASVRPSPPAGPAVSVIGRRAHTGRPGAEGLRAHEAEDVAAAIATAVNEPWLVSDGVDVDGAERWRPCRLGDITVLVPARTSLPFLEDALEAAGIAYRAESSSLVYATRAVRDLLMVLRAVDDPTDSLRIVSALRTPLFACGDDDLYRYKVLRGGSWNYTAPRREGMPDDDPVAAALAIIRSLHEERAWRSPSELLERIVRERRAFELGVAEGRPRDVWRRLRFVVDQARAWSDATGGALRHYLHWVGEQTADGARVAESVLPETDDDAVRIMTVHAAKGLEFPVTILSGMSTQPGGRHAAVEVVFPPSGGVGYRFGKQVRTDEYEAYKPIDEQMALDERIRLLYVACTRARDHLVVSLHRAERASEAASRRLMTNAEVLVDGMGDELLGSLPDASSLFGGGRISVPAPSLPAAPPPFEAWRAELDSAVARGRTPTAVAATALTAEAGFEPSDDEATVVDDVAGSGSADGAEEATDGLRKRPRDLDLPPWLKGRYGTAVGRAVHGVLQTIDLAAPPGDDLHAAVAAQCEAEAVTDRAADVRALVVAALGAPSVVAAAAAGPGAVWREIYACAPVGGRLLEGYVDLLYRGPDGLVVVDHKTAATSDPAELDRRVAGYRLQGGSYALVVAETTGEPVRSVVFVFLTPDGAVERELPDLDAAVAEVRALVAAGAELTVDQLDAV